MPCGNPKSWLVNVPSRTFLSTQKSSVRLLGWYLSTGFVTVSRFYNPVHTYLADR